MDWFKIKTKHVFHEGFDSKVGWAWIKMMALVATLEYEPNAAQILRTITKKEYQLLQEHFKNNSNSLQNIIKKVMEDAKKLKNERVRLKQYRRQQSQKSKKRTSTVHVANAIREDKIREDKIRVSMTPPTQEEVDAYCFDKNLSIDTGRFIDFYTSNGWKVGRNKMKDWKATVRNWAKTERRDNYGRKSKTQQTVDAVRKCINELGQEPDLSEVRGSSSFKGLIS